MGPPSCRCANKGNCVQQLPGSESLLAHAMKQGGRLIRFFSSFHEFGWRARAEPEPDPARTCSRSYALSLSRRVALVATEPSFSPVVRSPRPKRQPLPPPLRSHTQRPLLLRLSSRRRRPLAVQRLVGRPHQSVADGRREREAG